jgi:hypothetical protein
VVSLCVVLNDLTQLVDSLAWPCVAVVFLLLFKGPIREILGRLESVEGPLGTKITTTEKELDRLQVTVPLSSPRLGARSRRRSGARRGCADR